MDRLIWSFVKKYFFGVILIIIEFTLYTNVPMLVTQQLILLLVTFYLARISYLDEEGKDLKMHQVLAVTLGFTYGLFATVSMEINAIFFYAIVTFITKYGRVDSKYFVFTYIILLYFIFFAIRIFYFSYQHEPAVNMYDYFIKNLLVATAINSILCFIIMIKKKKTEKNNNFLHSI